MRKLLCGCLGVLFLPLLGWAGLVEDARKALDNKQYKQVIRLLDQHLKDKKDDVGAYLMRGQAHARLKASAAALADFNKTIELDPKFPFAYLLRGQVYAADGKTEKAMADFDKAIQLTPKEAVFYLERGYLHLNCPPPECKDKAFKDFDQALKLNPKLPRAYIGRARAVLEKSPQVSMYREGGRTFTAITGVRPFAAQQALPDLNKGISSGPKVPGNFLVRAMCHEALGDEVREVADRKQFAALYKNDARNLNRLAWVLASSANKKVRDGKAALEAAKQAVAQTNRKNAYFLDTLACACAATGDFKEAVATQETVIAMLKAPPKSVFHERLDLYKQNKPVVITRVVADGREVWKHSLGSFVKVGADLWEERDKDGKATFKFKEIRRTAEYVHIYDGRRGMGVQLYNTEAKLRYNTKESKWGGLYAGKWEFRTPAEVAPSRPVKRK